VTHRFDVVAVGAQHERAVIIGMPRYSRRR
jgi:hypothetical protein